MNACQLFSDAWAEIARRRGCERGMVEVVLNELLRAYSEPNRQYHTIDHIASLLRQLEKHGLLIVDRETVTLAILFHDVVYDPVQEDNEERSAALAREQLSSAGFPDEVVGKVERYILASKHSDDTRIPDPDLAVFLDLDLSILAASPPEYLAYAQAIRREYRHIPDKLYRTGRQRILREFLARERIFGTDQLHMLWEERARANILGEIADLAQV
jgi:predicted metal-dependent HD superfamily phosphohydrolase